MIGLEDVHVILCIGLYYRVLVFGNIISHSSGSALLLDTRQKTDIYRQLQTNLEIALSG